MDVMIFVFVNLLFVADIICAVSFKVKQLEIGASGTIPCDRVENDPGIRLVQWHKSKRIDVFVNGDPSLAQWADGATESLPNYHMNITTFSLVIENATLEDEGLYKCSVERGDLYTESSYYTRTVMYALPQKGPMITLDNALNRVNCTVEHVRPIVYPVFDFDWSPESIEVYAVPNEDGTYTTSVSCTLPQTKNISLVHCYYSYLHMGFDSSDVPDTTTDSLMLTRTTTVLPTRMGTSVTFAGDGSSNYQTAIIVEGGFIGLLAVTNIILLIMLINSRKLCHGGVQHCNEAKESKEKMIQSSGAEVKA